MSATATVSITPDVSFLPSSFTLVRSMFSLSYWNPLSHVRSPANPGAPDGGMYGCAANGVPCVMGTPRVAAAAATGSTTAGGGGGGGGGAGRERREDTQRVGKEEVVPMDEGMKYDCVRWTSGIEMRIGGGGREGERTGDEEGE